MRCCPVQIASVLLFLGTVAAQEAIPKESHSTPNPQSTPLTIELKPDASGNVPQEQIRELLRRVAENDMENDKRLHNYTYVERQETRKLTVGAIRLLGRVMSKNALAAGSALARADGFAARSACIRSHGRS